jgi:hypothetical protein
MAMHIIPGGYYLKARSIMNSNIMNAPPCTRELWDYILLKACYSERKAKGITLKRGQLLTSIGEIIEALSWQIGYRRESYSRDQMNTAMKTLRSLLMITSTKTLSGMVITICNYDYYQDFKNYETTNETSNENCTKPPMGHYLSSESLENVDSSEVSNTNIIQRKNNNKPPISPKGENEGKPLIEKKTWRTDFDIYLAEMDQAFKAITSDEDYIKLQEKFHPGVDIRLSLEKAKTNFWETEAGWLNKKSKRSKGINWKTTFTNAIDRNKVYKPKNNYNVTTPQRTYKEIA